MYWRRAKDRLDSLTGHLKVVFVIGMSPGFGVKSWP